MRINIKSITATIGSISLFAIIIIYSIFNSHNIVKGVIFDIKNPVNGMSTKENYIELNGIAKNAIKVSVNNLQVPVDEKGNFKETVILSPGVNNLTIKGEDKFGKESTKEYQIFSKQESYTLENNSNDIAISPNEENIEEIKDAEIPKDEKDETTTDDSYKL